MAAQVESMRQQVSMQTPPGPAKVPPLGSLYHCQECAVDWVGPPTCWSCGQETGVKKGCIVAPKVGPMSLAATSFSPSYEPVAQSAEAVRILGGLEY